MVQRLVTFIKRYLVVRIALVIFVVFGIFLTAFSAFFIVQATGAHERAALEKAQAMARQGAGAVQFALESALRERRLQEADLFDEGLAEIPGTGPKRYHSRYDAFTDSTLGPLQDVMLNDADVVFAIAIARNGYVPTHNQAERSKRLFDDPVGLASARNTEDVLVQDYRRDNGESIFDVSSPITVNGRHWGAFRVGLSKAALNREALAIWLQMGVLGTAVVLIESLIIAWLLRRSLRPLSDMERVVAKIADGDLDQRIEVTSHDEIGRIGESLQAMVGNLRGVLHGVRQAAEIVQGSVQSIGASAGQLSQSAATQAEVAADTSASMGEMASRIQQVASHSRTLAENVEQTSSAIDQMAASVRQVAGNAGTLGATVDETSAAIEEMASSIQQVARNVEETSQVASKATTAAHEGRSAVSQTVEGMARINQTMRAASGAIEGLGKRSEEIGAIVEVIDDIAEQTNLLALNAAIEAARAGEAGRGFAVVADEVRKLAERSAKATREIASLIQGIQQETLQAIQSTQHGNSAIQQGTRLAEAAGSSLEAIVASVDQVGELMGHVSQATNEQARAASQITQAVSRMSALALEVTQATREEATGAAQIIQAVGSMNTMTHEVSLAAAEQQRGCERTVRAADEILTASRETARASETIALSVEEVQAQVMALMRSIAYFKDGTPPVVVTSLEPAVRLPALGGGKGA